MFSLPVWLKQFFQRQVVKYTRKGLSGSGCLIPSGNGSYILEKEGTWAVHGTELLTERLKMKYIEIVTGI